VETIPRLAVAWRRAERALTAKIRRIFRTECTLATNRHRKSRDFEPTARVMRPNRSATTVIAPLAF
jgi:hypothetical protein